MIDKKHWKRAEQYRRFRVHRRGLLSAVRYEKNRADVAEKRASNLERVAGSEVGQYAIRYMTQDLSKNLARQIAEKVRLICERAPATGDYEVGLSIPSLHVRQFVCGRELSRAPRRSAGEAVAAQSFERIEV